MPTTRCMARKRAASEGAPRLQCTRKAIEGTQYCKQHEDYTEAHDTHDANDTIVHEHAHDNFMDIPIPIGSEVTSNMPSQSCSVMNPSVVVDDKDRYIAFLVNKMNDMSTTIDNITSSKTRARSYIVNNIQFEDKCMMEFYKQKRKDAVVLNTIRTYLTERNMLFTKPTKVYGGVVQKEVIPWIYVKKYTEDLWKQSSDEEKKLIREKVSLKYTIMN